MKKFIQVGVILGMLAPLTIRASSFEESYYACRVPICDISAEISNLRALSSNARGMYTIELKEKFKDISAQNALENLYEFGLELTKLTGDLNDQDWVVRAATDFNNMIIFNLAKYSVVNGEKLIQFYKKFGAQTSRYNLIAYWQTQISKIEDVSVLNELVSFAEGARSHSINVGDEDWVQRAASFLISEITMKLVHLDPAHEGLYHVDITHTEGEGSGLPFDKIAVLDSSSSKNLVVSFINSKLKVIVYTFTHAEISGNKVSGLFLSSGEMANKFSFELNRKTGEIFGSIQSTKYDKIEFSGKQSFSTRSIFSGKSPIEVKEKDILGTLKGELAGIKGTLTIKSFRENVYSAIFTSNSGSIILNFQGKFFSKNAVLGLTSNDKIKLTLSLREDNSGKVNWSGASFSTTTGTVSRAFFNALN